MIKDRLTMAAYHEAGHAIACYVKGHQFLRIEKLNRYSGTGSIYIQDFVEFYKNGIKLEDVAITFLSGPIAIWYWERVPGEPLPSKFWSPKYDDRYGIKSDLALLGGCLIGNPESADDSGFNIQDNSKITEIPRLAHFDDWSRKAEELIEEHWGVVKILAEALIKEERTIGWDEARNIIEAAQWEGG